MPIIDVHAHVTPERFKQAIADGGTWHGLSAKWGQLDTGGFAKSLPERLAEMDEQGVDMQVVSPTVDFYQYFNEVDATRAIARDCNDEMAEMAQAHPDRFAGLGTVPLQHVPSAVEELRRAVTELGLKGVMIGDHVNGSSFDEPEFLPFFKAADELGAVVFFHQAAETCVSVRIPRYKLGNAIGNLADRTISYASLVFGGVLDACPNFKPLLAHGGGYTAFGIARMDKVAGAMPPEVGEDGLNPPFGRGPDDRHVLTRAPSTYLDQFWYDCCTYDERALRYLIDTVGIDRVVLGTDYPAPMFLPDAVNWIKQMDVLTDAEKEAILSRNAEALLGLA